MEDTGHTNYCESCANLDAKLREAEAEAKRLRDELTILWCVMDQLDAKDIGLESLLREAAPGIAEKLLRISEQLNPKQEEPPNDPN